MLSTQVPPALHGDVAQSSMSSNLQSKLTNVHCITILKTNSLLQEVFSNTLNSSVKT